MGATEPPATVCAEQLLNVLAPNFTPEPPNDRSQLQAVQASAFLLIPKELVRGCVSHVDGVT